MKFLSTASQHALGGDVYPVTNGVVDMPASVAAGFGLAPAGTDDPKSKAKAEKADDPKSKAK